MGDHHDPVAYTKSILLGSTLPDTLTLEDFAKSFSAKIRDHPALARLHADYLAHRRRVRAQISSDIDAFFRQQRAAAASAPQGGKSAASSSDGGIEEAIQELLAREERLKAQHQELSQRSQALTKELMSFERDLDALQPKPAAPLDSVADVSAVHALSKLLSEGR